MFLCGKAALEVQRPVHILEIDGEKISQFPFICELMVGISLLSLRAYLLFMRILCTFVTQRCIRDVPLT